MTNVYTSLGYLQKVVNAVDQTPYWTANAMDAQGQLTQETLGNGLQTLRSFDPAKGFPTAITTGNGSGATIQSLTYEWDTAARLLRQHDLLQGNLTEQYGYDSLNRLSSAQLLGSQQPAKSYQYDATGNITSKSDFGSYTYGENGAGPHAVTSTSGIGGSWTYAYDQNGNMTDGLGRTIQYYSFNQTKVLSTAAATETFEYGPEREQIFRQENSEQTFYVGKLFERVIGGSGTVDKDYILAAGAMVAVHQPAAPSPQAPLQYFHKDYRRSILAIHSGGVVVRSRLELRALTTPPLCRCWQRSSAATRVLHV